MEYNNYIPLEKISIRYKYFCFIDTKEYPIEMFMINCNSTPDEIEVPFTAKVL